jgi:WD40 repeat protein
LIPYLRQQQGEKWHILDPIRLGTNPVNALNRCLAQLGGSRSNVESIETWSQQHPNTKLLLVIDQFEELITLTQKTIAIPEQLLTWWDKLKSKLGLSIKQTQTPLPSEEKSEQWQEFLVLLADILKFCPQISLILTLRSDFEPRFLNSALKLEEGKEDRALTVAANFDRQGGVAGSLTRRANQEYHNLADRAHRLTMRRLMLRMVEIEGGEAVRRRVTKKELEYIDPAENERVAKVLDSLDRSRLIVGGDEAGEAYVEPAHDFLVRGWDKLQEWLQKAQKDDSLNLQRLLTPAAFDWQRESKSPQFLWNANPRLDLLGQILRSPDNWFNRVETEFVRSSIARKKFNVRLRWGIAIAVITLLSGGLAIALIGQRNAKIGEANAAKQSARVNLVSRQALEPMLDSLRAGTSLKHPLLALFQPTSQLAEQIRGTLQWSVYQVAEINRMQGDTVPVRSILNPQGNLIASAQENGTIRLWNLEGKELKAWQADPQRVWDVAFSPDRDLLASAGQSGTISLWDLQGNKIRSWQAHKGQMRDVSFSPNGRIIATAGGEDGILNLWNLQGDKLASWPAHKQMLKSVSFSPDGQLIATSGLDRTVRIWDFSGQLIEEFPVHAWKVVFSPDGKLIASAGDDGFIHLWNEKYQQIGLLRGDNQRLWNVTFSPDSQTIASAGEDGSPKIWDVRGQKLREFSGHTGPARRVSFSPDGKILASSGDDGTTRLWSLEAKELANWQGDRNSVNALVFSPDGQVLVSGGQDNSIHFWDLKNLPNNSSQLNQNLSQGKSGIKSISISSDGKFLVTASDNNIVRIWDLNDRSSRQLPTQISSLESVLISPDDRIIAVAGGKGSIELWDLQINFRIILAKFLA